MKYNKPKRMIDFVDEERVGFLDIETSNLDANFGMMYSWCIKSRGSSKRNIQWGLMRTNNFKKGFLDTRVVKELSAELREYDRIITYYGTRFDVPYIRTRAARWGMSICEYGSLWHSDLYYIVRNKYKFNSNRLNTVANFLQLESKTPIDNEHWINAHFGDTEGLEYILKHNKKDVIVLEDLFNVVLPHMAYRRTSV